MKRESHVSIAGTVTDIFGHRIVLENEAKRWLADLGPASIQRIVLTTGMHITLTGEMKSSELRAETICIGDGLVVLLRTDKGGTPLYNDADLAAARTLAEARGLIVVGTPRRKPKHFEVLARDANGAPHEVHIDFDGTVRKIKPVDISSDKWQTELEIRNS